MPHGSAAMWEATAANTALPELVALKAGVYHTHPLHCRQGAGGCGKSGDALVFFFATRGQGPAPPSLLFYHCSFSPRVAKSHADKTATPPACCLAAWLSYHGGKANEANKTRAHTHTHTHTHTHFLRNGSTTRPLTDGEPLTATAAANAAHFSKTPAAVKASFCPLPPLLRPCCARLLREQK